MADLSRIDGPALDVTNLTRLTTRISELALENPHKTALVLDGVRMSFAQLDERTQRAQGLLTAHNITRGDCLGWCGLNHLDFFPVMLAAMRMGAVLVPINWRQRVREISHILTDCDAKLIICDTAFIDTVRESAAGDVAILATADFSAMLGNAEASLFAGESEWDQPSLLLYTSGTTGSPKGVQISEKSVTISRLMEQETGAFADWSDGEVLLSPLPLFHIGGISWASCGLYRGCALVLTNNPSPAAMLDLCLSERVSRTFMVPQLVRGLIDEMLNRAVQVPSLKGIHYGAAPMDAPLLARGLEKIGCQFLQYFGMTEMGGTISILPPHDHDLERPHLLRSVGCVLPGSSIEIRDINNTVVPIGQAGEIWTTGPTMMLSYANRPDQTSEAIVDGWYRTGDGGKLDAEGFLYLTDRIKDMIVTGGENVYPIEVESVLREHPVVADCAVFGLPDAQWGERVCAAVEVKPGQAFDADALITFVKGQIAGYKAPRQIEVIDALPRTASGKIQRGKVRADQLESGKC